MIFLYTSTTIIYFLFLMLTASAVSMAVLTNEDYMIFISIAVIIIAIFGFIITGRLANRKYKKSLSKLNYDLHSYLDEQYKFLNKLFVNKNVKNFISLNIADGYINNEQYNEALNILSEFATNGYQGLSLEMRFLIFMNQATCYLKLKRLDMVSSYIQNGQMILHTARFPANINYELNQILEYTIAEYNYQLNQNPQTAQELINKINAILNHNIKKVKTNVIKLHYELAVLYMRLGDTAHTESEFYYILQTGSILPCVNRIKAYNKTGDISSLEL